MRSRYGNAYWQVGQETLKKAASTGPCLRAACNENLPSSLPLKTAGRLISGALVPAGNAAISLGPPNTRSSHFMEEMPPIVYLDDAASLQDFSRQSGDWDLGEAIDRDPLALRGRRSIWKRRVPYNMNRIVGDSDGMAKRAPVRGSRPRARRLGRLGEFPHTGHERGFSRASEEPDVSVAATEHAPDLFLDLTSLASC